MADFSKFQALPFQLDPSQHRILEEEEDEDISSEQTLHNPNPNCSRFVEDDDLVSIDYDGDVPYTSHFNLNFNPFSPFDSFFLHNSQGISDSCSSCASESESESPDSVGYPDGFHGQDEEYDQMDFITDLFDSRGEVEHDSGTGVGIRVSDGRVINYNDDNFVSNNVEELGLGFGGGGLRVVGIESDSDTEELDYENHDTVRNLEHFWDCPSFDHDGREESQEVVDDGDGLSSVIDRIEEISISSDISSEGGDATVGALEWEILIAVNNLERDLEFESDGGEGFVYTAEFDTLIGQFVDTVRALKGSPPAAKLVVDNLPSVALTEEGDHGLCAVCKDEISVGEKVTQLPCRHHYHGECIMPWLSIRNTCPVCRFELPTDDVDYERMKNRMNDNVLQVGYDSELSP